MEVAGRRFAVNYVIERRRTAVANFSSDAVTIKMPRWLSRSERIRITESLKRRSVKHLERLALGGFRDLDDKKGMLQFRHMDSFNVLGKRVSVLIREDPAAKRARARMLDDSVHVILPAGIEEQRKQIMVSELVRRVLSKHALPAVKARMDELNRNYYNFRFNEVRLRRQSRLWGSTSHPSENIHLNFKLLFAPPEILDYVIAHELSHLKRHDHSPAFWELVSRAVPDHKARRKWLRQNGSALGMPSSQAQPGEGNTAAIPLK